VVFGPTYPSADHRLRLELELRYLLLEHGTIFPEGANSAVTRAEGANDSQPLQYDKLNRPQLYKDDPELGLARLVPQDGRIQLAFDLHWQDQKNTLEWRQKKYFGTAADGELELESYLLDKAESKNRSLKDVGKQIRSFGDFFILDIDPFRPEYTQVVYRMEDEGEDTIISEDEEIQQAWSKRFVPHNKSYMSNSA
jgi:hypothetical protein